MARKIKVRIVETNEKPNSDIKNKNNTKIDKLFIHYTDNSPRLFGGSNTDCVEIIDLSTLNKYAYGKTSRVSDLLNGKHRLEKKVTLYYDNGMKESEELHYSNGVYIIRDYDINGNEVHFKNSNGGESYAIYDENNRLKTFTDSDGYTECRCYHDNGQIRRIRCVYPSCNFASTIEYDEKGRIVYEYINSAVESERIDRRYRYDSDGNCIVFNKLY